MKGDPPPMRASAGLTMLCLLLLTGCAQMASTPRAGPEGGTAAGSEPATHLDEWPLRGQLYTDARIETDGTLGADFDVDVSPDGLMLAFASTRFSEQPRIFLRDTRGGGVIQKTSGTGRDIQPKFSPDGKRIAFASDRYGNFDVLIISAQGTGPVLQLTSSQADEIHPTWSPDGRRLAYCAREPGGDWTIWVIELEGQRRTRLGPGLYPEWSPDGQWLAFQRASQRGPGWYGIWVVEASGGAPREVVTEERRAAVQPSWAPNSRRLAYATAGHPEARPFDPPRAENLWIVDLDLGTRYQLTSESSEDYAPAWGLDGRIYFTSLRGGTARIWSARPVDPAAFLPGRAPRGMDGGRQ